VRFLSEDGYTSTPIDDGDQSSGTLNVGIANKYEGPEVVKHGAFYYLFVSATDWCRGPLTGYAVLVGRSPSPTGPFLDRDGIDLNDNEGPADPTPGRHR
jgi:arabinan endo-1,5-alpha-L-arabinosidase